MALQQRSHGIARADIARNIAYVNVHVEQPGPPVKEQRTHLDYLLRYELVLRELDTQVLDATSEDLGYE